MERYLKNGREIFEKFCVSTSHHPTMLPRAPEQTYVDLYPTEDVPGSSFKDDRQHQVDYETEVKVYRALEKLEEELIVLHSFEFTHHQYCLCDKSHMRDKKKCKGCKNPANREGECDFLVLGPEYCVLIEVKNMAHVETKGLSTEAEEDEDMESEGGEKSNKLFNDSEEMSGEKDSSVGDKTTSRKVEEDDMVTLHEDSSQKVYNDVEEGKGPSPVKSCKPLDLYHNVSIIAYCYKRVHLKKVRS